MWSEENDLRRLERHRNANPAAVHRDLQHLLKILVDICSWIWKVCLINQRGRLKSLCCESTSKAFRELSHMENIIQKKSKDDMCVQNGINIIVRYY